MYPFSRNHSGLVALCLCLWFALTACGKSSPLPAGNADTDWEEVNSSGEPVGAKPYEAALARFMRKVELSDLHLRELGTEFWRKYPQDPRRYKWLILTVHMPPHYPMDLNEWARNETKLIPNAAAIDVNAVANWNRLYAAMRTEFWSAKSVTDADRRFLWFGELEQRILRMREAVARGESVDMRPTLEEAVLFARTYPEPFSVADSAEFSWLHETIIAGLLSNADSFNVDMDLERDFVEKLERSGNSFAAEGVERIARAVEDERVAMQKMNVAERAWRGLNTWPIKYPRDQPSTSEARIVFFHDLVVFRGKIREIGLALWDEYPDQTQRLRWLNDDVLLQIGPANATYLERFAEGIRLLAQDRSHLAAIDSEAKKEWERRYPELLSALWNDPTLAPRDRALLRNAETYAQLWEVQDSWLRNRNKSQVQALLSRIRDLYTQYEDVDGTYSYASVIFHAASKYGLSDEELRTFVAPMLKYADSDLRKFAEGKLRLLSLREVGVELQAPTLDGKPFDLREMRGKVVLIDYWATTCAACFDAMPRIKRTYDTYRDRGFEVLSVCFDGEKKRRQVERAEKEMGLTWTTLAADSIAAEIQERYGYSGVPEYMLIDREGKLVATSSEVDMGRNLEALIQPLLK